MPQAAAGERLADFREIDLGYSQEEAIAEAQPLSELRPVLRMPALRQGLQAGRDLPRSWRRRRARSKSARCCSRPASRSSTPPCAASSATALRQRRSPTSSSSAFCRPPGRPSGHVVRPSDGKTPKRLAFIQCVGSRDTGCGNDYCSSVCCMAATKEAILAKEHEPDLDITIFFLDLRAFGKDFDRYYERARNQLGVRYVRSFISRTFEMPGTKNLARRLLRTSTCKQVEEEFDMVVLSLGLEPSASVQEQAERLGVDLNRWGFARPTELRPLDTSRPGRLRRRARSRNRKTSPTRSMQASAAAARAMALLAPARGTRVRTKIYPPERDVTDEPPRVGVFVCHCGSNIASVVDVERGRRARADAALRRPSPSTRSTPAPTTARTA